MDDISGDARREHRFRPLYEDLYPDLLRFVQRRTDDGTAEDVVAEVSGWLAERALAAEAAGVVRDRIWLDPGIGFGKTLQHNLALTADLRALVERGYPVLYGASRKRMIQTLDPTAVDPLDRLGGSLALALEAARQGAAILRVHDVRQTVQALSIHSALEGLD